MSNLLFSIDYDRVVDRTEAVLFLLSLDSTLPSRCDVSDKTGHPALVSMITNMPQMVRPNQL